ncbi:MAG: class I SAM-dependent methyltransferase, partial [Pseudomonadota bacterium]
FDYVWDQDEYDPITAKVVNYIHFKFPDRSRIDCAFRYEWRLWSIPEVREALTAAGFSETIAYWEGTDQRTGEGNGVYREIARLTRS